MANLILQTDSDTPNSPIGVNWVTSFINRRPEIKSRFSRRYNYSRALCEGPRIIREFFNELQKICSNNGILDEDIYNFDETGFAMGMIATAKVVTRREMPGRPWLIQPGNREWVTTIECINTRGFSLPTTIIFKGKVSIEGWYDDYSSLPEDWRIELSSNGWKTDDLGLRWLQKPFIPATTGRTVGRYRLLVLDGHGSHLTPRFDAICKDNNNIPISMPANSSHLLQPLDVGCFGPLKKAYGRSVEDRSRLGKTHIDKFDFLKALPAARQDALTVQNTQSGFTATGIAPFDPQRVPDKLNIRVFTPEAPSTGVQSSATSSALVTPHTVRQLRRRTSTLQNSIQSPDTGTLEASIARLEKLERGFEISLYDTHFMAQENRLLRQEITRQQLKTQRSRH
ncbi:Transposase [Aspergillus affinis]|uniref:Transposase n=1 Tax=Aspergillus affinis TaxID=1070780 RepID=UPI0022FED1B1|nr:Transposase [Aspergillus affinis]KAI9040597.1 Transposase [Aspergillus affinis]